MTLESFKKPFQILSSKEFSGIIIKALLFNILSFNNAESIKP